MTVHLFGPLPETVRTFEFTSVCAFVRDLRNRASDSSDFYTKLNIYKLKIMFLLVF